jgi:TonB family protein
MKHQRSSRLIKALRAGRTATLAILLITCHAGSLAGQEEKIYGVEDRNVRPPKPLKIVEPEYDESARASKVEGKVRLSAIISKDGRTKNISVNESLDGRLDVKAIAAARQWLFEPAQLEGKPVAFKTVLDVNFRLKK